MRNWSAAFVVLLLVGCPTPPPVPLPLGPPAPIPVACARNFDCGTGQICANETCVTFICTADDDCAADQICHADVQLCGFGDLCEPGASACDDDEVCLRQGARAQCTVGSPATCRFPTDVVHAFHDEAIALSPSAFDQGGARIPFSRFVLSAPRGQIDEGVYRGACEDELCVEMVRAVSADDDAVFCDLELRLRGPLGDGTRVTVIDESGRPLVDARVLFLTDSGLVEGQSDTDGVARVAGEARALTVVASGFDWQSIIAPPRDVLMRMSRAPERTERTGQLDGSQGAQPELDIRVGLVGAPLRGSIAELNCASFGGPPRTVLFELEGFTSQPSTIDLPNGSVINLPADSIKPDFAVDVADREPLWSIYSNISLSAASSQITTFAAGGPEGECTTLQFLVSLMDRSAHGLSAPVGDELDWHLTPSTLMSRRLDVEVPRLPCRAGQVDGDDCAGSAFADAVVVVGTAQSFHGAVPLGIASAVDTLQDDLGRDGIIETETSIGRLPLELAPPHDGLDDSPERLVLMAIADEEVVATLVSDDVSAGFSTGFLEQQGGNRAQSASNDVFELRSVGFADLYRLRFTGAQTWDVWFADAADGARLDVLPLLPADLREVERAALELRAYRADEISFSSGEPLRSVRAMSRTRCTDDEGAFCQMSPRP